MARRLESRPGGIGEPSSKYGYDRTGEKFNADIQANNDRAERLWADFIDFMQSRNVKPSELRQMFTRYYEEFLS